MKTQLIVCAYFPQLPREQPGTKFRCLTPPNTLEPKTR